MLGLFKNPNADKDAALVKQALGPDVAVVVSASCCMQGTGPTDGQVASVVQSVLDGEGLDWPVLTVTVTQAQSSLGRISGELGKRQRAVADEVSELFLSTGLSAFPVLIVNQRIVSFGGVPGETLVREAVHGSKRAGHEAAA
jgi:hypothetical protein